MNRDRNDYEPIIAERRSHPPVREDAPPLWHLVLALGAGLALVALLALWWMDRSSRDNAAAVEPSVTAPEVLPEERIEQTILPPAQGQETDSEIAQAPEPPAPAAEPAPSLGQAGAPESDSEGGADNAIAAAAPPAPVSVRFTSPDAQMQVELRGPLESSPPVVGKVGEVVSIAPGTYRVMASGDQLQTFEQEVTFDAGRSLEYAVELCAQRENARENLAGQVVEERECGSTEQCESMFTVLSEYADQLVQDRAFRTKQCVKWRPGATAEGRWRLDIRCGGATLASTCRIEVGEGACTFAEPRVSVRGTACPKAELR